MTLTTPLPSRAQLALFAAVTSLTSWCHASPHSFEEGQRITVAIPDGGGLVSLGVFSEEGSLLKALRQLAPESDFLINTNGLAVVWDGSDDKGNQVPPGTYSIKGWFVPADVTVEGVAVHFNDWTDEDGNLPLAEVLGVVPLPNQKFLLVGKGAADGEKLGWQADEQGLRGQPILFEGAGTFLTADENRVVFESLDGNGVVLFSWDAPDDARRSLLKGHKVVAAALQGERLWALTAAGKLLEVPDVAAGEEISHQVPEGLRLLAAGGGGLFASDGAGLWHLGEGKQIPTGDTLVVNALSAGPESTVWVAGTLPGEAGHPFARQYSMDGDLLRELKLESAEPIAIFTPQNSLALFVLTEEESGKIRRLRGLLPVSASPTEEGVSDWEVFVDRTIEQNRAESAAEQDPLKPVEGSQGETMLVLAPNSLNPKPAKTQIRAAFGPGGAWLEDSTGLQIAQICLLPNITATTLENGSSPGTLRMVVFVPGGALEYEASELGQIVQLQGGEVEK